MISQGVLVCINVSGHRFLQSLQLRPLEAAEQDIAALAMSALP